MCSTQDLVTTVAGRDRRHRRQLRLEQAAGADRPGRLLARDKPGFIELRAHYRFRLKIGKPFYSLAARAWAEALGLPGDKLKDVTTQILEIRVTLTGKLEDDTKAIQTFRRPSRATRRTRPTLQPGLGVALRARQARPGLRIHP